MTTGFVVNHRARALAMPVLMASVALALAGCATRTTVSPGGINDPFEPANRAVFWVNDLGDRYLLRPVASGYERGLPPQLRKGVRNIFSNMLYPVTVANAFLQGKFRQCGRDGARFILNSTVGLAGIFDPATRIGLAENDEDFDQTLAVWGAGEGPYLVIPIFGPRILRHLVGDVVDAPLTPFVSVTSGELDLRLAAWVVNQVDQRSRLLDADRLVYESYDPYIFVRDAYLQRRRYLALDGNVPEDESYLDEAELDDAEGVEPETGPE